MYDFNNRLGSFAWKVIVCSTKVRDKLLDMEKVWRKSIVSPLLYKAWANFFHKKALRRERNFLGQFFFGMFYIETNDQIMQGWKLMVKRFQRSIQVSFFSDWPWSRLLIYNLKMVTLQIGDLNILYTLFLWDWEFHLKTVFF